MDSSKAPPSYDEIGPPGGPPPSKTANPHETAWQAIPDTALLPPPPMEGYRDSPMNNAPEDDAVRAHDWCHQHPLIAPLNLLPQDIARIRAGRIQLLRPQELRGQLLSRQSDDFAGSWKILSLPRCGDCAIKTSFPLYSASAAAQNDLSQRLVYFEVQIVNLGPASGFGMGFVAAPYPGWRLPGWERGGLGVHSDDGRKYVNDTWGGKDFTAPFRAGERVGIGMRFSGGRDDVRVFFTRGGKEIGSWEVHEERDAEYDVGPYGTHVEGLEGRHDLYGCVGVFEGVDLEVFFERKDWLWRPT